MEVEAMGQTGNVNKPSVPFILLRHPVIIPVLCHVQQNDHLNHHEQS